MYIDTQARKIEDLGSVNLEDEADKRQEKFYIPNWFSAEVKTGVSLCVFCQRLF